MTQHTLTGMKNLFSQAAVAAVVVATVTACGADQQRADDPQGGAGTEPITVQGVAALVEEHLGAANVQQFASFGDDEQSVGVMVRLRGAGRRDMFMVGVTSPDGADQEYLGGTGMACEQLERRSDRHVEQVWCEDLADGGVASVSLVPYGFSDDNKHGRVLMGTGTGQEGRLATAMYESYTPTVAVEPEDLLDLMADERLAWTTDPAVNDAGRDIDVRLIRGG